MALVPIIGIGIVAALRELPVKPVPEPLALCGNAIMSVPEPPLNPIGETIFKDICYQCHAINDIAVGPVLKQVSEHFPEQLWEPLLGPDPKKKLLRSPYYRKLSRQYDEQRLHIRFKFDFTATELAAIRKYIDNQNR